MNTAKLALSIAGVLSIIAVTIAIEFVALLWHSALSWLLAFGATAALYGWAWFGRDPILSGLPLLLVALIGVALGIDWLLRGAPHIAAAYFAIGLAVGLIGATLIRSLRQLARPDVPA